jgi:chromosome segregation ATPase
MASNLEVIHEDLNSSIDTVEFADEPEKMVADLQEKIMRLEKMNQDLKAKSDDLQKENIENASLMKKMGYVGQRRKFTVTGANQDQQDDSVTIAKLTKEKDDLQEINEKMLDLIKEKEVEITDLGHRIESVKMEAKIESDKNMETIRNLEDKVEMLENEKNGNTNDIDDVVDECNKAKEKLRQQINEYSKEIEDLRTKIDLKDRTIQKLNDDIQQIELEKLNLINNNQKNQPKDTVEIEKMKSEIDKLKRENQILEDKLKTEKESSEKLKASHQKEIKNNQKQVEEEQNNTKNVKEEKSNEINLLKTELNKVKKNLKLYTKRAEISEKKLYNELQKNYMLQEKIDKKTKELQDLNELTKKILANKDTILSQHAEKIEAILKDKNELLTQNKQLLNDILGKSDEGGDEKINPTDSKSIQRIVCENRMLKEEVKGLKEQIDCQVKDLVDLSSYEKEIIRLKSEIESLSTENKALKTQIEQGQKGKMTAEEERDFTIRRRGLTQISAVQGHFRKRKETLEGKMNQINFEKKLNALMKMKADEKKDFEAQIEKINLELAELKLKNVDLAYENDILHIKYKNLIKTVTDECKKKGIKININY